MSATQLTAVIPAGASTDLHIVTTPSGTAPGVAFEVLPTPQGAEQQPSVTLGGISVTLGGQPEATLLGNLDGDGDLDAMTLNKGTTAAPDVQPGNLDLLLPRGTNLQAVRLKGPVNPLAGTGRRVAPRPWPYPPTSRVALAWPGGGAGSLTLCDALGRPVPTQPLPAGPATV